MLNKHLTALAAMAVMILGLASGAGAQGTNLTMLTSAPRQAQLGVKRVW